MKQGLYDDKDRLAQPGLKLRADAANALRPFFQAYVRAGFSAREVSHVIQEAVSTLETESVLFPNQ